MELIAISSMLGVNAKLLFLFVCFFWGEGVMSESKLLEELFVVVSVCKFLMQGGGVLTKSKQVEELFCFS